MHDESPIEKTDLKRLETKIDDLRCVVFILIIIVSLLSINEIFQSIPQFLIFPLSALGFILILSLFLLLSQCTKNKAELSQTKESGAPAGT